MILADKDDPEGAILQHAGKISPAIANGERVPLIVP